MVGFIEFTKKATRSDFGDTKISCYELGVVAAYGWQFCFQVKCAKNPANHAINPQLGQTANGERAKSAESSTRRGRLELRTPNSEPRTPNPERLISSIRSTDRFSNRFRRAGFRFSRILEKQNRLQMSQVFPFSCIDDQMGVAFQGFYERERGTGKVTGFPHRL